MRTRGGSFTTFELLEALLVREESEAWQRFDERYRPLIAGVLRRMGIGPDDAEDLAQDTLVKFLAAHREGKFEPGQQRLRAWLLTAARNGAVDRFRKLRPQAQRDSILAQLPHEDEFEDAWDTEREELILREGLAILRSTSGLKSSTLRAFELTVLQGRSAQEAAEELDMRVGSVYVAKHRCMDRFRRIASDLREEFSDDGDGGSASDG